MVLRKTKSVCPVCLNEVEARVEEMGGRIYLSKNCNKHGNFKLSLSGNPTEYKDLEKFYFSVMPGEKTLTEYEMWVTMECNTRCSICHLGDLEAINIPEPGLEKIENYVKNNKAASYVLSGGEPTCREDLPEIIHIFKKHKKMVSINTNGLKLENIEYLKALKAAGLDRVNLQFDGFLEAACLKFRGKNILKQRIKILENLKQLNVTTDLNITIGREINEREVGDLICYAAQNRFISSINFFTICYLGQTANWPLSNYIMPDEVVDWVEKTTDGIIKKKNIYLFQKLHLALKSFLERKFCLYSRIFVLLRINDSYLPADNFLALERTEKLLDFYKNIYRKNKTVAKIILALCLPFFLIRWSSFRIFKEMILTAYSYVFKKDYHYKRGKFFYINFNTSCDPYKMDYSFIENCQDDVIYTDKASGKLRNYGADGLRAIEFERESRQRASKRELKYG